MPTTDRRCSGCCALWADAQRVEDGRRLLQAHAALVEAPARFIIALQQRTRLGVEIGLANQEWKVYLDSQDTLNYDLCRAGWIADYTDPNTFMDMWVTGGGNNDTGWSNATYDALLDESAKVSSDAERFAIYQKLEAMLADEVPIIPLYFYTRVFAMNPKLRFVPNVIDRMMRVPDVASLAAMRVIGAGSVVATGGTSPFRAQRASVAWLEALHAFRWLRHMRAAGTELAAANAQLAEQLAPEGAFGQCAPQRARLAGQAGAAFGGVEVAVGARRVEHEAAQRQRTFDSGGKGVGAADKGVLPVCQGQGRGGARKRSERWRRHRDEGGSRKERHAEGPRTRRSGRERKQGETQSGST